MGKSPCKYTYLTSTIHQSQNRVCLFKGGVNAAMRRQFLQDSVEGWRWVFLGTSMSFRIRLFQVF